MTQALPKLVNFEEFVEWLPENSALRYELHNRDIVEMAQPVGEHEAVISFLAVEIPVEIKRLGLPYGIPRQVIVRPPEKDSGYFPDVLVLNRANLANETLWQKQSILSLGASIPLVIEVVSTNWRDDYYLKYADYEEMGIPEYWIVDPQEQIVAVLRLESGEYVEVGMFQGEQTLVSPTFPQLNLTAGQVLGGEFQL